MFEQSLNKAQSLLSQLQADNCDRSLIHQEIVNLVQSVDGARGFFVVLLSDDTLGNLHLEPTVISALQSSPEIVAQLLTKNLAMSTAMQVFHDRNSDREDSQGSLQVQKKVKDLIQALAMSTVDQELQQLKDTLETGAGTYQDFLEKFNYDSEQKAAILHNLINIPRNEI